MGAIIQLLLRLLGHPAWRRRHVTFASQSTDLLPIAKRWKPWLAALLHAVPVLMVFGWIGWRRSEDVTATAGEIAAIAVTSCWCVIGPALIWTYERYTLLRLARSVRRYVGHNEGFHEVRKLILTNTLHDTSSKIIVAVWIPLVAVGLLSSESYLRRFGLFGLSDPLFWIIIGGVMYVAAYAGAGISFLLRSIKLIRSVIRIEVPPNIYAADATFGLSFLGRFALSTNLMYLSGWLFMPALFVSAKHGSGAPVWITHTLLATSYAAACLFGFFWSISLVHRRLEEMKCALADSIGHHVGRCADHLRKRYTSALANEFLSLRATYKDILAVNEWPLSLDVLVRFTASVVLFPLFVNILAVWWVS